MAVRLVGMGRRVLFVAAEKGREYITNLLVSSVSGVDKRLIIKDPEKLTAKQDARIRRAVDGLFGDGLLTVLDNPVHGLIRSGKWTNDEALNMMGEVLSTGACEVAIWDIWQRMLKQKYPDSVDSALGAFYDLNKAAGTHSVVVQQLHRRTEDRSKDRVRRPTLSDLKQSGAYEEFSDLVLFVHREKVLKRYIPRGDWMEVTIGKQKLGEDGVTMLAKFKPRTCRLRDERLATDEDARPSARFAGGGE